MKKRLGVLALATAMLLGMTGCGGQKEETAEPGNTHRGCGKEGRACYL